MKKALISATLLILTIAMVLGLSSCFGEKITLVNKTIHGVSLDIPSDFGEFTDKDNAKISVDEDSTASITVSPLVDAEGLTPEIWDENTYKTNVLKGFNDLQMINYSNTETVGGVKAVKAHYTAKNDNDIEIEAYSFLFFTDDGKFQSISFNYNETGDTSLKENIDAIINSIKLS